MPDGPRLLIAAALARIIEPYLRQALGDDATVRIAEDQAAVRSEISDRLRFDVVVADLTWNDYAIEYSFDGLDVLDILRNSHRQAPVIFAPRRGTASKRDHLDEAIRPARGGGQIYRKAKQGPQLLVDAVDIAVRGGSLTATLALPRAPARRTSRGSMPISARGRGRPLSPRLAGAIASGRAVNHESLASSAHVGGTTPPPRSWITSGRSSGTAASTRPRNSR